MKTDQYLPKFMKDFHDQKDIFKLIDKYIVSKRRADPSNYIKFPSFVDAHIYTIDIFLAAMFFYGYKLQKCRKKGNYGDLKSDIEKMNDETRKQFSHIIHGE